MTPCRRAVRSLVASLGCTVAVVAMTAACTSGGGPAPTPTARSTVEDLDPSAVVSSLGAVPIPPSHAPHPTPSASAGRPALSAVGGPIAVSLGAEGRALVTVLGPEQADDRYRGGPAEETRAYLTLQIIQRSGSATVRADELSSRDETGRSIPLHRHGPARVTTHAGKVSAVRVVGTFDSGAAQVTWRHRGHVLAVWTFNVELD